MTGSEAEAGGEGRSPFPKGPRVPSRVRERGELSSQLLQLTCTSLEGVGGPSVEGSQEETQKGKSEQSACFCTPLPLGEDPEDVAFSRSCQGGEGVSEHEARKLYAAFASR